MLDPSVLQAMRTAELRLFDENGRLTDEGKKEKSWLFFCRHCGDAKYFEDKFDLWKQYLECTENEPEHPKYRQLMNLFSEIPLEQAKNYKTIPADSSESNTN